MNLTFHILKKDIRRLRVFLGFWLLTVISSAVVNGLNATTSAGDFALQYAGEIGHVLIQLCLYILMIIAVPLLMHSEPLVGTTAFWQTRPLNRWDVLKSKLLFAGIFFVLMPVLVNVLLLALCRVPMTGIFASIPETALTWTGSVLLFMTLAALTRNVGFYVLVTAGYFIASIALMAGVTIFRLFSGTVLNVGNVSAGITDTRALLSGLVSVALCSTILFLQFKTKKLRYAYGMLVALLLLSFWVGTFSEISFFSEPKGTLRSGEIEKIELVLDRGDRMHVRDSFSLRKGATSKKDVAGGLLATGLSNGVYATVVRIEANCVFEDGMYIESTPGQTRYNSSQDQRKYDALAVAVAPLSLIPEGHLYVPDEILFQILENDYLKYREKEGIYTANVALNLFRFVPVVCLPLKVGAHHKEGFSVFTVESVLKKTEGCDVVLREQKAGFLFLRDRTPTDGDRHLYLLVNRKSNEAFVPKVDQRSRFGSGGESFAAKRYPLRFTSAEKGPFITPITEEWLADAELMIVERKWLGKTVQTLKDESFTFGRSGNHSGIVKGKTAKDNMEKLSALKLSPNASRAEVKDYIRKIHEISSDQSRSSWDDPQVGMLAAVGPENLDLLLEGAERHDSYSVQAIKRIAGEEHKELILKYLSVLPRLAGVVVNFGWQEDARDILLAGLQTDGYLPSEWVSVVAGFEDPETYSALIGYFVNGRSRAQTYRIIKNLPGIELNGAVPKVWAKTKYSSNAYECRSMIPVAMEHGILDALGAAGKLLLGNEDNSERYQEKARTAIQRHVGEFETDGAFVAWLNANKGTIRFDPETKMFSGTQLPAPQPEAPSAE